MMNEKLKMIKELMDELAEKMEYGKEDFDERLGRKKPGVEVLKIEGEMPMDEHDKDNVMERAEELTGQDLDNDMEMGEDPEHAAKVLGHDMEENDEDLGEDEKLVKRMMKLRE